MKIVRHLPLYVGLALAGNALADNDTVGDSAKKAGEAAMTGVMGAMEKNTVEVDFEKGSSKLSEMEVTELRSLIKAARDGGQIEKIYVGAWADKAFSEGKGTEYTDADKNLAKERAKSVEKVLDEIGAKDVEVVNLADKPNWFAETVGTEEAKIKDTVAGKDVTKDKAADEVSNEDREMAAIGKTMKSEGGASKAVVVVQPKVAH